MIDIKLLIFGILGGLGIFLYGIHILSDALQKVAGNRIRLILSKITNNRFVAVGVGALVTSIIQSSSATSVIVVGFVNAGLMNLMQALGVILGANLGTTITAQLIAFKLTDYALAIIAVGSFMFFFGKKRRTKEIGMAIFGFGLLFLGLSTMSGAAKPLAQEPFVRNLFINLSKNPILGILIGLAVTGIIQSSSASIGLVITLAIAGLIDLNAAIPLVIGGNIGTCVTALLASMKSSISAKRAAVGHLSFNIIGAVVTLLMLPIFSKLAFASSTDAARQIANFHTMFNVFNLILFLPFLGLFVKLVKKIVPGKDVMLKHGPKYINQSLLLTPQVAIGATKREVKRMLLITRNMVKHAMFSFYVEDQRILQEVDARERAVDDLQREITHYLVLLTQKELTRKQSEIIPLMLHSVNDIERIGDHAVNITELSQRKHDQKLHFSKEAIKELKEMQGILDKMFIAAISGLQYKTTKYAKRVLAIEEIINKRTTELRESHTRRLHKGDCNVISGLVFMDVLMNFEKIGDHLTNIAQARLQKLQKFSNTKVNGK